MKTTEPDVSRVICSSNECLIIPVYQRQYEWNRERWQSLIRDIANRAKPGKDSDHWIGIVLMSRRDNPTCPRDISDYGHVDTEIIDGQQRILTLRIWLQALFDYAEDTGSLSITPPSFVHISCQEMDRLDFKRALNGSWKRHWRTYKSDSSGLLHAYTYFRYLLWLGEEALTETEPVRLPAKSRKKSSSDLDIFQEWEDSINSANRKLQKSDENNLEDFILRSDAPNVKALIDTTLKALTFLALETQPGDEEPSEIFDALNGQRMELEQFDHVRNFIFTGVSGIDERKNLYDNEWVLYERAVELNKDKLPKKPFNSFMYEYMISLGEGKYQQKISKGQTKMQFVRYFNSNRVNLSHEAIARDSLLPAMRNWLSLCLNGGKFNIGDESFELPSDTRRKLFLIEQLSQGPATPILMNILSNYFSSAMGSNDQGTLLTQVSAVESFLARKVLLGTGLQPLRSQLMQVAAQLGMRFTEVELVDALNKARPSDKQLREAILPNGDVYQSASTNLYDRLKPKSLLSIFQGIETHLSGGTAIDLFQEGNDTFTIEHIYPRSSKSWGSDLGLWGVPPAQMNNRLHVLGNLTIYPSRVNTDLSNHPFAKKVAILTDSEHKCPKLNLNLKFINSNKWRPKEIDDRTGELLENFLKAYK
jgi:hypothetical protein